MPVGPVIVGRVLREIRNVRQEPTAPGSRRWFDDDILPFELIVWYAEGGAIEGFQICYDLGQGERALTWRPAAGFAHRGVDSGSTGPFANRTPILVADGAVPWAEVSARFDQCGRSLEPPLREFVRDRLEARK